MTGNTLSGQSPLDTFEVAWRQSFYSLKLLSHEEVAFH